MGKVYDTVDKTFYQTLILCDEQSWGGVQMKKVLALGLIITLALTVLLSGCQTQTDTSTQTQEGGGNSGGRTKLAMWFWGCSDAYQKALNENLAGRYNAMQDQYELVIEYRETVDNDISVAIAANSGPDVVYGSGPAWVANYAKSGKLESLAPYVEEYGWRDKLMSPLYEACTVDGELYSIPISLNTVGLYYSKSVLEENDWAVPTTIDELYTVMDEAQAKGMYAALAGNKGWRANNEVYTTLFLNHFAGPEVVYRCLTGEQKWNTPDVQNAVRTSADWYKKGYLGGNDYTNISAGEAMALLASGKSPFVISSSQFFQFANEYFNDEAGNTDDLGFAPFPGTDKAQYPTFSIGTVATFSVNASTSHKDEAAKILNIMISKDFMTDMTIAWPGYWGVPLWEMNIDMSRMSGLSLAYSELLTTMNKTVNAGNFAYFVQTFFPSATYEHTNDIDTVWEGVASPEEFLSDMDIKFQKDLDANLVPPIPKVK